MGCCRYRCIIAYVFTVVRNINDGQICPVQTTNPPAAPVVLNAARRGSIVRELTLNLGVVPQCIYLLALNGYVGVLSIESSHLVDGFYIELGLAK